MRTRQLEISANEHNDLLDDVFSLLDNHDAKRLEGEPKHARDWQRKDITFNDLYNGLTNSFYSFKQPESKRVWKFRGAKVCLRTWMREAGFEIYNDRSQGNNVYRVKNIAE